MFLSYSFGTKLWAVRSAIFNSAFVPFITRSLQFSNCQNSHQRRWRSSHIPSELEPNHRLSFISVSSFFSISTGSWQLKHFLTLHHCFVFILLFASTVHRKPTKIRAFGCTRYAYLLLLRFILKHTSYVCFTINCNTAHPFPNATIIAFNTSFFRGSALLDLLAIVCNLSSVCLLIGQTATP